MGADTRYLKECLGKCLIEGLTQVVERQPADPINFLACWIYRYDRNLNEEKKRKEERAQLEQEREEALAELERIEKLKAEELQMTQKYEDQQKALSERYPEKIIANLPEKSGAPNLPTVEEIDESHFNDKRTEEEDANLPEENEMAGFKQETLEDLLARGELNASKNEFDEMLQGNNISESLQGELHHIPDDEENDQSAHLEQSDSDHDIQTGVDTADEE